jgi:HEAT repeat protein
MKTETRLLNDAAMREFIANGYVTTQVDLPRSFHDEAYRRLSEVFEKEGNPGNNLLPRIPMIQKVLDDPSVHGALTSVAGGDYLIHPHRHPHYNPSGSPGQGMHKDAWARRHHRPRLFMAFYYPQDTPEELGPTAIVRGTHLYNTAQHGPNNEGETRLTGEAGTVTIVHYDLWHRGTPNRSDKTRFMVKFLFLRLSEPTTPTWDNTNPEWEPLEPDEPRMWRHLWKWYGGRADVSPNGSDVATLVAQLGDRNERVALDAAYALGEKGEPALGALMDALREGTDAVRRNAGYGLTTIAKPAVGALVDALRDERPPVREAAASALADMGGEGSDALSALMRAVNDPSVEVRRQVADGIGIVGAKSTAGVPALVTALKDPDEWVRRNASVSLMRLGSNAAEATSALVDALEDANRYVRAHAVTALLRIGTPQSTQHALDFLMTSRWCPTTTRDSTF